MTDLLSIGASSVRAYQTALTTVSENIANAGNDAYVRRSANLREVNTLGGKSATFSGLGVVVDAIRRSGDPYAETSLRSSSADLAKTESSKVWLQRIETALGSANVTQQMTSFFAAGTALAAEPTSTALRSAMLSSANSTADAFGATGRMIDQAASELDLRATQATDELTRLNQAMLKVNQGLGRTPAGTAASAQLADQRDQILEQMSAIADINVQFDGVGRATVRAGGAGGPALVDSGEAAQITYARAGGNVVYKVVRTAGASALDPGGGALAGMAEGAQRLQDARDSLDDVADDFVKTVNKLQVDGDGLDGQPGAKMFEVAGTGTDKSKFSVVLDDVNRIAAAGRGGGQRDSSNLTLLAGKRQSEGFETRLQTLVTSNAATLKQRNLVADAQTAIRDGAVTARSEASGVNLDSEAIDLVRFQQAYQASSRLIQVARETFQSLLDIR